MSPFWIVIFTVIAVFVLLETFKKPIVLEGGVVEKNIAQKDDDDSYVTIETAERKKVVLKFETHSVGILMQIGGESFQDRAEELDMAIALNDKVSVETFDKDGLTRDVYKLLSVART